MKKGFSLVELLVAIAIMAILMAVAITGLRGARQSARDATRKSDLEQYKIALEGYSTNHGGSYLIEAATVDVDTLCVANKLLEYFGGDAGNCPEDPVTAATADYKYIGDGTEYKVWATLETGGFWQVCSTGNTGYTDAVVDEGDDRYDCDI